MIGLMIAAVVLLAVLIGLYVSYRKTFYTSRKTDAQIEFRHMYLAESQANQDRLSAIAYEPVEIRSYDGLKLCGRYYEGKADMPLCVCFHGYRGYALRDCSAVVLRWLGQGYRVLLVDERAHGGSGGCTITFGVRERYDVLSWTAYANRRFGSDQKLWLFGISMGAATVLMSSGLELPDNVCGIIADCPYSSPKDIILHVCGKMHLNPKLCAPVVSAAALIYGHFSVNSANAADAVKKTKVPILIIHGEGDTFVPASMSRQVYEANSDMVEYHTVPGAGHGLSCYCMPEEYMTWVDGFMQRF